MSHVFPTLQSLVDSAIRLEYKRREMGEQKRKATSQGQSGSVTRPRFAPQQNTPFRYGGSGGNFGQYQSHRPTQPFQQSTPQTPRPTFPQNQQRAPMGTPVKVTTPPNPTNTTCCKCGELGHYANVCPQREPPSTPVQNQQGRNGNQTPQTNKGQQSYSRGKVNHVDAEAAQENPKVVLGMFLVNSVPASVLFDSGASHSFITSQFVAQHNIPISLLPRHMLVSSPGGNESIL
jgi:hypothetical protein